MEESKGNLGGASNSVQTLRGDGLIVTGSVTSKISEIQL